MTKVSGADLKVGDIFKHSSDSHGGRIYEVVDLEDADYMGARYGDFRMSNGEITCFNVFTDSEYELRDSMPGKRKRIVKVAADDLKLLLDAATYPNSVRLLEAVARLQKILGV